jgi:hypothetical protein
MRVSGLSAVVRTYRQESYARRSGQCLLKVGPERHDEVRDLLVLAKETFKAGKAEDEAEEGLDVGLGEREGEIVGRVLAKGGEQLDERLVRLFDVAGCRESKDGEGRLVSQSRRADFRMVRGQTAEASVGKGLAGRAGEPGEHGLGEHLRAPAVLEHRSRQDLAEDRGRGGKDLGVAFGRVEQADQGGDEGCE